MSHSAGLHERIRLSGRCSRGCAAPSATTSPRPTRGLVLGALSTPSPATPAWVVPIAVGRSRAPPPDRRRQRASRPGSARPIIGTMSGPDQGDPHARASRSRTGTSRSCRPGGGGRWSADPRQGDRRLALIEAASYGHEVRSQTQDVEASPPPDEDRPPAATGAEPPTSSSASCGPQSGADSGRRARSTRWWRSWAAPSWTSATLVSIRAARPSVLSRSWVGS